ncbi:hypothetical protein [Streptomyces sp. NPDC088725]|uniref:hypothetical protein n=1 Tax=Streptomyces sp. NPDC088725 TaxID=3365873 RepID=UPI003806468E
MRVTRRLVAGLATVCVLMAAPLAQSSSASPRTDADTVIMSNEEYEQLYGPDSPDATTPCTRLPLPGLTYGHLAGEGRDTGRFSLLTALVGRVRCPLPRSGA